MDLNRIEELLTPTNQDCTDPRHPRKYPPVCWLGSVIHRCTPCVGHYYTLPLRITLRKAPSARIPHSAFLFDRLQLTTVPTTTRDHREMHWHTRRNLLAWRLHSSPRTQ